jgi:hypothetical protein
LQLKSTPTLLPPKMIKNDCGRICYTLTTHWTALLCISFHAKRGYFFWIYGVVLWAPQSSSLSRGYQGLYRVYPTDTIRSTAEPYGSAVPMHLKAPHRTYLSKPQTWRKEAGHTRGGGVQPSPNPSQSPTTISVPSHCLLPGLIAWKKCIEIAPFYRWTKVTWVWLWDKISQLKSLLKPIKLMTLGSRVRFPESDNFFFFYAPTLT